ncbi:MAG: cupin domain-containing protein [Propionibacterium acidifaciens]|uniref:cupin domain-containing protein n=1 Tax=Propionibacterium acidifaciens TaxID=556499 RepID=UPI003623B2D0
MGDGQTTRTENVVRTGIVAELPLVAESIVSRILVDNDLLQVTQFTFGAGQTLSEHTSSRAAVVQVLEGELVFRLNGEDNLLRAGDCLYMAPDTPHSVRAETDCRMALVLVDPRG